MHMEGILFLLSVKTAATNVFRGGALTLPMGNSFPAPSGVQLEDVMEQVLWLAND